MSTLFTRLFIFPCILIQTVYAQNGYNPAKQFPPDTLKSDFQFLRQKLETVHPGLYRYTSKKDFDQFFDSLYKTFNEPLNEQQFLSRVQLMHEKIRDGHTMFLPDKALMDDYKNQSRFLPFSIAWLDNKLYITENNGNDTSILIGMEITKINGVDARILMSKLMMRQIRDGYNTGYPVWILENYFAQYYGFVFGLPVRYTIVLKTAKGETITKRIRAFSRVEIRHLQNQRYKYKGVHSGLELKLTKSPSTVLLKIETFNPDFYTLETQQDYKKMIDYIFVKLRKDRTENLILDLRGNTGGEFEPARLLLSYLIIKPSQFLVEGEESRLVQPQVNHFIGRIILLINGGTFSAASILTATLQRDHRVVLIGEETGGNKYEISGDEEMFLLPSTHLQCLISTKNYKILNGINNGHGVMPDYKLKRSIDDIVSGRDAAMDMALTLP